MPRLAAKGLLRLALLAVLAATTPARGLASVPDFAQSAQWIELRTQNFTVITDAGPGVGWDVAHKLERFAEALGRLNPELRPISPLPTAVFVFREQSELERYRPAQSENLVAFFGMAEDRNVLVLNGAPEGEGRGAVVFHEFVHCYLHGNLVALPTWLDEGLAIYYSTCRMSRTAAEFGKADSYAASMGQGPPPISLEMMFAFNPSADAYRRDSYLRDQLYMQGYLLTHWLQSPSGGRAARFEQFLARLHHGREPQAAFRDVFPSSEWEAMIAGLNEYRLRLDFEPRRSVEVSPPSKAEDRGERPLSSAEALTRLGELQLWLDDEHRADAAEHFQAALGLDPGVTAARALLGLTADLGGRVQEAEGHYGASLAAVPGDAHLWDVAARGVLRRLYKRWEAKAPRDTLVAIGHLARERYRRSLQLAPDGLEALGGYGQTFAMLGEPADTAAVRSLERAVEALPGRTDLAAALSVLKAQQGKSGEVEALLARRVAPGASHAELKDVQSAVAGADLDRIMGLAKQGKGAEAESLLERLAPTSEEARQALESLRNQRREEDVAGAFSEAVLLANSGRLEEARARFVEARDRTTVPEVSEKAAENIRRIDAEIRLRQAADLTKRNRLAEAETTLAGGGAQWPDDESRARAARALADVRARREIERALALAKAGKLADARAAFTRVLDMDVPESTKGYARDRIRELEAAIARH